MITPPPHKCNVLSPFKVSEHVTILRCAICDKEVARWEDIINPSEYGKQEFSDEERKRWA